VGKDIAPGGEEDIGVVRSVRRRKFSLFTISTENIDNIEGKGALGDHICTKSPMQAEVL
jgi:hypothetical protein